MENNSTAKWTKGLPLVQAMKNNAYRDGIKCSPYEGMFGVPMKLGLTSIVGICKIVNNIHTEEDFESVINVDNEPTSDVETTDPRPNKTEAQNVETN